MNDLGREPITSWKVAWKRYADGMLSPWVTARVPGAVQLDWMTAQGKSEYWKGSNLSEHEWMEDVTWVYRSNVRIPVGGEASTYLVFQGIDYYFSIMIDGETVGGGEGMFSPVRIDVTRFTGRNCTLEVVIYPHPKATEKPNRDQARESCKPPVSYGWDWHPRLIPSGLWDGVFFEIVPHARIESVRVVYQLSPDFCRVDLAVAVNATVPGRGFIEMGEAGKNAGIVWQGEIAAGETNLSLRVEQPRLWWPSGQGDQSLYTLRLSLDDTTGVRHENEQTIGFRRARLVMNEGEWKQPSSYPMTCSRPPATIEINGRRIFAMGSNWVSSEIFPGTNTEQTYQALLELVRDAHMNILRIWGGSGVNKDVFYTLCDRLGIMVWQEFPLACNTYPDKSEYLQVLDKESRSIIERLRVHPSVVMWCGGNELFNDWSGMTPQSHALRLLDKNCYELDLDTPFLMTSPQYGMGHGPYHNIVNGREFLTVLTEQDNTAYTEFGCPGPSTEEYLRTFMTDAEFQDFRPGTVWQVHHAFDAFVPPDTWFRTSEVEYFFGDVPRLEDKIEKAVFIQGMAYRSLFEEMRRQWPRCSMALNWCLNEPWPTAANNSLINWPAVPRPAYEAVKTALRPVMASLRVVKNRWTGGEIFETEVWMLNDSPVIIPEGCLVVYMETEEGRQDLVTWKYPPVMPGSRSRGPTGRAVLPESKTRIVRIGAEVEGKPDLSSAYEIIIKERPCL